MNWNRLIRQGHRWVSMAFVVVVLGVFAMLGMGQQPAQWVYLLPLAPLFLLVASGLYLFALPYLSRSRRAA